MAFVFMISAPGSIFSTDRRQIGGNICDGLDAWFFIIGENRFLPLPLTTPISYLLDFFVHHKHLGHFCLKFTIAPLKVIGGFMGLNFGSSKDVMKPTLAHSDQRRMSIFNAIFADVFSQLSNRPPLRSITVLR